MVNLDGVIIVDETGRPIIQTNFRNVFPSYPLLHVDAFNNALEKVQSTATGSARLDPVLFFNIPASPDRTNSVCCHVERNSLHILCLVSVDVDPLYVFAFVDTLIGILEEYLGDVSSSLLKEHFDIVYQLLEEMLDDGVPLTTEPNTLRDIVLPPSLLNKILGVAGAAGLPTATPAPFSSPIPWRKAGLRYNNNEIYFDIMEELNAVISNTGKTISHEIWGKIHCNARLSGTPDLLLSFSNPHILADPSLHPCVRLNKFATDKSLSFVPPDGNFTLMEYRVDSSTLIGAGSSGHVPLLLKSSIRLSEEGGSIEISASCRLGSTKSLENVTITLFLGKSASSASFTISDNAGIGHGGVSAVGNGTKEGSWDFEPKTQILRWNIPSLLSAARTIKGTFTSSVPHPRISRSLSATFSLPQSSLSGLKVEQMKMAKEGYKPYKGVRFSARGSIEWRL
ncbi:hypothetical protein BS47DRAFT_1311803 [Hydnum rufescens UP504]|uniref:MHD domain-containing protein n=1 Tax=Hydnum rufescens UP504 TaxID=1448309 RepID=A0A9P6E2K3_9AGAM|nr:hypothetical protein BS47DRAFT_1311803 [Hydnum rufescens UP504]